MLHSSLFFQRPYILYLRLGFFPGRLAPLRPQDVAIREIYLLDVSRLYDVTWKQTGDPGSTYHVIPEVSLLLFLEALKVLQHAYTRIPGVLLRNL